MSWRIIHPLLGKDFTEDRNQFTIAFHQIRLFFDRAFVAGTVFQTLNHQLSILHQRRSVSNHCPVGFWFCVLAAQPASRNQILKITLAEFCFVVHLR